MHHADDTLRNRSRSRSSSTASKADSSRSEASSCNLESGHASTTSHCSHQQAQQGYSSATGARSGGESLILPAIYSDIGKAGDPFSSDSCGLTDVAEGDAAGEPATPELLQLLLPLGAPGQMLSSNSNNSSSGGGGGGSGSVTAVAVAGEDEYRTMTPVEIPSTKRQIWEARFIWALTAMRRHFQSLLSIITTLSALPSPGAHMYAAGSNKRCQNFLQTELRCVN